VSATRDGAIVENIKLRSDGDPFLAIKTLRLDYAWPDIRDGKLEGAELDGVNLHLGLDENWAPKNTRLKTWLEDILAETETREARPAAEFPRGGIKIGDGELFIDSPLGKTDIRFESEISSPDKFTAALVLSPTELNYQDYMAHGAGLVDITKNQDGYLINGQFKTDRLSSRAISLEDTQSQFSGYIDPLTYGYKGQVAIQGGRIDSEPFTAGSVNFYWDGNVLPTGEKRADGLWRLDAKALALPMEDRQEAVADALSLYPSLSVIPVSEHYADPLKQALKGFFSSTNMIAKGHFEYGSDGFTITAREDVSFISDDNTLILSPKPEAPIYKFDRSAQALEARMDAQFSNPVGLSLNDITLNAGTPNGYQLSSVTGFAADIFTKRTWTVTAKEDQRPVRLGPLSTRIDYKNLGETPRNVRLKTVLDYDGPVPGGRIENLDLSGQIDVQLFENRQVLDFRPDPGTVVQFDRLETPTDWTVGQARIDLPYTKKIFVRSAEASTIRADLTRANFILEKPALDAAPAQEISLSVGATALTGLLRPDRNMAINIAGMADNYSVDHSAGTVKLIGSDLAALLTQEGYAVFPADGQLRFEDEAFIGMTRLKIAKADNASVNIDYRYANGAGTADIDIPSVKFDPSGLQPQTLLPTLRGKIALVTGEARARFKIGFADGALTDSSGQLDLIDMDAATAPGPLEGMNTSIAFSSLWPVETQGMQTLTMKSFNPGYALKDGVMTYQLIPDGIKVESAKWPIGAGFLSLDPFQWIYAAEENKVIMRVENISLGDFLTQLESDKLQATGTVTGHFPITVRGVQVLVDKGELSIPDGGIIQYESGLPGRSYTQEEALAVFREKRSNEYAAVARDALKEFGYKSLTLKMDGPLDGRIDIGMVFDGSNPKILNSQPFRFHLNVGGKLLSILQSFNSTARFKSEILDQTGIDVDNLPTRQ